MGSVRDKGRNRKGMEMGEDREDGGWGGGGWRDGGDSLHINLFSLFEKSLYSVALFQTAALNKEEKKFRER